MSSSYDLYERSRRPQPRRGTYSYWVPLAATIAFATLGVAAWIWSERNDDDEAAGDQPIQNGSNARPGDRPGGSVGPPSYAGDLRPGETGYGTIPTNTVPPRPEESQGYIARMSGALQRAPSPQEFIGGASRSVAAGVAAAGAAIGTALSSIREEDRNAYGDHRTWSEEAQSRRNGPQGEFPVEPVTHLPIQMRDTTAGTSSAPSAPNGTRKTVAVVVSAEADRDDFLTADGAFHQHAVRTSHKLETP